MIGLILVGILVVLFMGGSVAGMVWVYIIVAAIGAPLFQQHAHTAKTEPRIIR